jgi:hypothetical protein
MIMISDMFNSQLKARIDGLCNELSSLIADQPELIRAGTFQNQSQGGEPNGQQQGLQASWQQQGSSQPAEGSNLFMPQAADSSTNWWPADLGWPNSVGAQDNLRYAYFAQSHRLAIESNGKLRIYDTLDHQIGGVSQQQSQGGSLKFTSQYGQVDLAGLPLIADDGLTPQRAQAPAELFPPVQPQPQQGDIFMMIEKLADLRAKGILSEEEFSTKKADLLNRL